MADKTYPGNELETFALAHNWKSYYANRLAAHITGDVLEVGAGIGATSRTLCSRPQRSWTCLEPDPALAETLERSVQAQPLPIPTRIQVGCVSDLDASELFDCILYIDVLEHIANDQLELTVAARHLRNGGALIALSPAHHFLFSRFDQSIGHHRRYDVRMLRAITPATLAVQEIFYLDSVGMLLSLANRVLLQSSDPSARQILFWDRYIIPLSRWVDRAFAYRVGKTVIAIWQRR